MHSTNDEHEYSSFPVLWYLVIVIFFCDVLKNVSISVFSTISILHYIHVTQSCQHELSYYSTPKMHMVTVG